MSQAQALAFWRDGGQMPHKAIIGEQVLHTTDSLWGELVTASPRDQLIELVEAAVGCDFVVVDYHF